MRTSEGRHAWSRVLEEIPVREDERVEVVGLEGEVLFSTDPARVGAAYERTAPSCAICHEDGLTARMETARIRGLDGDSAQAFGTPLRNDPECLSCHEDAGPKLGMVLVRQPLGPLQRRVRTIQLALALAGAAAFLLTVTTTRILLERYLGRPIRKLVSGAEAIGTGSLHGRIELPDQTELTVVAETLNSSAAKLEGMVSTLAHQRDDFQTLYGLVDQLSRAVHPDRRRRRSTELASRVLKKECALVRVTSEPDSDTLTGSITYRGLDGLITDRSLSEPSPDWPAFFDQAVLLRWQRGEFGGEEEIRTRAGVAYPLRRRGRDLGLLFTPAGDFPTPDAASDPAMVTSLKKHLAIGLAYSDLQRDVIAQERLAAIGETVAGLAHCLKNVLNGLRAGVYVTNRALELDDREKLETGWRVLQSSVAQVERLTFDMLYYVKGRMPEREPVDPNAILEEIADLLRELATSREVEIRFEPDPAAGTVLLDRTAVYRAVLNLASNGIDACTETETGDLVVLRCEAREEEIVLSVTDNGAGMSDAVKKRLFTRFYSTKRSQGTGLGLPVAKKVAEEHGGSLEFDSEPGRGTTFRIRLPRQGPEG